MNETYQHPQCNSRGALNRVRTSSSFEKKQLEHLLPSPNSSPDQKHVVTLLRTKNKKPNLLLLHLGEQGFTWLDLHTKNVFPLGIFDDRQCCNNNFFHFIFFSSCDPNHFITSFIKLCRTKIQNCESNYDLLKVNVLVNS